MKERKGGTTFKEVKQSAQVSSASSVGQFQQSSSQGLAGAGGMVGTVTRMVATPAGQFQEPGVARGTAPRGGNSKYQHIPPSFFLGCLALLHPQAGARWAAAPGANIRETPDSFQKFSMQEGLWAGKWIRADRLPTGLGEGERIPHLGMNLQETTCRG